MAASPAARSSLPRSAGSDLESPLGYSDGTKFSRPNETPGVPNWRAPSYGLPEPDAAVPGDLRPQAATRPGATTSATPTATASTTGWSPLAGPAHNAWWNGFWANDKRFCAGRSSPGARSPTARTAEPRLLHRAPVRGARPGRPRRRRRLRCSTARTTRTTTTTQHHRALRADKNDLDGNGRPDAAARRRPCPTIGSAASIRRSTRSTRARRTELSRTCQDYKPFGRSSSERPAPAPS